MYKKELYFQKQYDVMDCGPSCLAMIAKHYGLQPNVEPQSVIRPL